MAADIWQWTPFFAIVLYAGLLSVPEEIVEAARLDRASPWTMLVRIRTLPSQRWAVNREFNRRVKYCFDENAVQSPITSYRVQGWLPPGSERPIPKPEPPPQTSAPMQDAAE